MRRDRGCSQHTIAGHLSTVNHFLTWLDQRGVALADIRRAKIDAFLAGCQCGRSTIRVDSNRLRGFFRLAAQSG